MPTPYSLELDGLPNEVRRLPRDRSDLCIYYSVVHNGDEDSVCDVFYFHCLIGWVFNCPADANGLALPQKSNEFAAVSFDLLSVFVIGINQAPFFAHPATLPKHGDGGE